MAFIKFSPVTYNIKEHFNIEFKCKKIIQLKIKYSLAQLVLLVKHEKISVEQNAQNMALQAILLSRILSNF